MTIRGCCLTLAALLWLVPRAGAQETVVGGLTWMQLVATWNAGAPKLVSDGLFYYAVFCGRDASASICSVARKRGDRAEPWTISNRTFVSNQPATVVIDRKGRLNIFYNDLLFRHIRVNWPSVDIESWTSIETGFPDTVGYMHASYDAIGDEIMVTFNETNTWRLYLARMSGDGGWSYAPLPAAPAGSNYLYARTVKAGGRYAVLVGQHPFPGPHYIYTAALLLESAAPFESWTVRELHRVHGDNLGIPYQNWVLNNDLQADSEGRLRALLHITENSSGHAAPLDGLFILREEDGYEPRLIGTDIEDGFTLYVDPSGVHLAFVRDLAGLSPDELRGGVVWFRSNDNGATWEKQPNGYADLVNPTLVDLRSGSMLGPDLRLFATYWNPVTGAFDRLIFAGVTVSPPETADRYTREHIDADGTIDYVRVFRDVSTGREYFYDYEQYPDQSSSWAYRYLAGSYYQVYMAHSDGTYRYYNSDGIEIAGGPPRLIPSAATVNPGGTATFAVSNGPANRLDWVGWFCPASNGDAAYVDWKYLSNNRMAPVAGVASAMITFTAPAEGGTTCDARLFADNSFNRLVTSATMSVTNPVPALSLIEPTSVPAGAARSITVTGLNFVPASIVHVNGAARWTTFVSATRLTVTVPAGDVITVGASLSLTVVNPAPGGGTSNAATLTVSAAPTITPAFGNAAPGSTITFTVQNSSSNRTDWVGWYCPATDDDTAYLDWKFLNDSHTAPGSAVDNATVTFTVRSGGGGSCEARLFANGGFTELASASVSAIDFNGISLILTPTLIGPGRTLTVRAVLGSPIPTTRRDWVGLYCPAANGDRAFVDWKYMNDATTAPLAAWSSPAAVTFAAPANIGVKCDARLFRDNSFDKVIASWPATVTASTPTLQPGSPTVGPAGAITIAVTDAPGNPRDWVGMYCPAANADVMYADWKYLSGTRTPPGAGASSATLTFTAPAAGSCNFRLFVDDGFTRVATSATVAVQ